MSWYKASVFTIEVKTMKRESKNLASISLSAHAFAKSFFVALPHAVADFNFIPSSVFSVVKNIFGYRDLIDSVPRYGESELTERRYD
jgi:hypothetical protein